MFSRLKISKEEFDRYQIAEIINTYFKSYELPALYPELFWYCKDGSEARLFAVRKLLKMGASGRHEPSGSTVFLFLWHGYRAELVVEDVSKSNFYVGSTSAVHVIRVISSSGIPGSSKEKSEFFDDLKSSFVAKTKYLHDSVSNVKVDLIVSEGVG